MMENMKPLILYLLASVHNVFGESANIQLLKIGEEKLISSLGYPYESPYGYSKLWNIKGPSQSRIELVCTDIYFPRNYFCSRGSLTVFNSSEIKQICGASKHLVFESENNEMKVKMVTSARSRGRIHCFVKALRPAVSAATLDIPKVPSQPNQEVSYSPNGLTCDCGWITRKARIVGGTEAQPHEYSFMVNLRAKFNNKIVCGGSIISEYHILTAAHCVEGRRRELVVGVGEHDIYFGRTNVTQHINVKQQIAHENYDSKEIENDIAILVLEKKIVFSRHVGPVCLPHKKRNLLDQYVTIAGWGDTKTTTAATALRHVRVKVIDIETCSARYSNTIDTKKVTQLCTYTRSKDSCQGDSGGPLIWVDPDVNRYTQVALVSYGKSCASSSPAVNTDIFAYMDWIEKTIRRTSPSGSVCKRN